MSIADELQAYNDGLLDAYDAVDAKGGTIPANKNLDNLPTAIGTISGGGGGALDPEQVYRDTRPADWMVMPEIGENEDNVVYCLLMTDKDATSEVPVSFSFEDNSLGTKTLEFGTTDAQGLFTPNSSLTVTSTGDSVAQTLQLSDFGNLTSNGQKQLMCKLSGTDVLSKITTGSSTTASNNLFRKRIFEVKAKATQVSEFSVVSIGSNDQNSANIRYFSLLGSNQIQNFSTFFYSCRSLVCVLNLDTSSGTNFATMFYNCSSLTTIPQLDTSSGTNFGGMFASCYSLTAIPQLDTSSGTSFSQMFYGCAILTTIPLLDTSSGTAFNGMFYDCRNLTAVPQLNTSSGTNFSGMFNYCLSLTTIPLLDTSSGTDFSNVFTNCYSLTAVPQLDTSSGTNFAGMFNFCASLTAIPQLDTSSGTNFQSMLSYCYSLTAIPQLDTSNGTNLSSMFSNCYSLTAVPQLDTSSGTNFANMFYLCYSLTAADLTSYDFSSITTTNALNYLFGSGGSLLIEFGDTFGTNGIINTGAITSTQTALVSDQYLVRIKINKTDGVLPISVSANTLFTSSYSNKYTYVYVPDNLLTAYQADTYWSALGTRLKGFSELPS